MTEAQDKAITRACQHECLMRELVEALSRLEVACNSVAYCYDKRPENFAVALCGMGHAAKDARAVLARAKEQQQ